MTTTLTTRQIADHLNGTVIGDGTVVISGMNSADKADEGDITFAEKASYLAVAEKSRASAVLVAGDAGPSAKCLIRVANVRVAVAKLLLRLHPLESRSAGISSSASVDPTAQVDPTAHIGPNCVIGENVVIGPRAVLQGGNHVGHDCQIGADTHLFPQVVVYPQCQIGERVRIHAGTVIGSDGYGYVFDEGRHLKMLQIGNVIIGDDVEIGSNTSIDRGAFGPTTIGQGTKIDNLVHIAHNVVIGRNCLVMGQCGFAGSTELGDYCVIASQSGIAGHLKLGRQATVGAKSGVMRDIPDGETVVGIPAYPDKQSKRQWIAIQRLPDMMTRMRELEKQVENLTARLTETSA